MRFLFGVRLQAGLGIVHHRSFIVTRHYRKKGHALQHSITLYITQIHTKLSELTYISQLYVNLRRAHLPSWNYSAVP